MHAAILAAAGSSERFRARPNDASHFPILSSDKLFVEIDGVPVVLRSAQALAAVASFERIVVVVSAANLMPIQKLLQFDARFEFVVGGATRQESIWLGLEALKSAPPQIVLMHDAARCLVTSALLESALQAALKYSAVTASLSPNDSIHQVSASGKIERALDRATLRAVQTPQAFNYQLIYAAHQQARAHGKQVTDDAALLENVVCIPGEASNIKITTAEDVRLANFYLQSG